MRLLLLLTLTIFLNTSHAADAIVLTSEANDPLAGGQSSSSSEIEVSYVQENRFNIVYGDLSFKFSAPNNGKPFQPSAYLNAGRWSTNTNAEMQFEKSGTNSQYCYEGDGEFYLYEYEAPDKLALDFVYYCIPLDTTNPENALRGSIRLNSDLAIPYTSPIAIIDGRSSARESAVITLDGTASFTKDAQIDSYLWQQTKGPIASILSPNTAETSIQLPSGILL